MFANPSSLPQVPRLGHGIQQEGDNKASVEDYEDMSSELNRLGPGKRKLHLFPHLNKVADEKKNC